MENIHDIFEGDIPYEKNDIDSNQYYIGKLETMRDQAVESTGYLIRTIAILKKRLVDLQEAKSLIDDSFLKKSIN